MKDHRASISRPLISFCIPAYNRIQFLLPLLDSLFEQIGEADDVEILICEDHSPQREQIRKLIETLPFKRLEKLRYIENEVNMGYDGNIRKLVSEARGSFCFFMGNDDLLAPRALSVVRTILLKNPNLGFLLKSYAWFTKSPQEPDQTVRYFEGERHFMAGVEAISVCFRRAGVISGLIINRDSAERAATDKYDGSLYYQMHITGAVLVDKPAISTDQVLVLSRATEAPDFGASSTEKGIYTPGAYTPVARVNMLRGITTIIQDHEACHGLSVGPMIMRDYANYFYPYIKDQLQLPLQKYFGFYRAMAHLGFGKYSMFHAYFLIAYILKEKNFDALTRFVRNKLGRSPMIGLPSK